jgi:hypothetical protein
MLFWTTLSSTGVESTPVTVGDRDAFAGDGR